VKTAVGFDTGVRCRTPYPPIFGHQHAARVQYRRFEVGGVVLIVDARDNVDRRGRIFSATSAVALGRHTSVRSPRKTARQHGLTDPSLRTVGAIERERRATHTHAMVLLIGFLFQRDNGHTPIYV
jgi:hypothetical protein